MVWEGSWGGEISFFRRVFVSTFLCPSQPVAEGDKDGYFPLPCLFWSLISWGDANSAFYFCPLRLRPVATREMPAAHLHGPPQLAAVDISM